MNQSLGFDLHAHLIPGVDDGVRTVSEGIEAIHGLKELGFDGCVVTPHIYRDVHPNTAAILRLAYDGFLTELRNRRIEFRLQLAAEYFADEQLIALARSRELLSFGPEGASYVLMEFPYISEPLDWSLVLSEVTRAGYRPVIAHPERYRYFVADAEGWLERFGMYSPAYQCEIGSLAGQYGAPPMKVAKRLRKLGIPAFWGTDLHRPAHIARFIRPGLKELRVTGKLNPLL